MNGAHPSAAAGAPAVETRGLTKHYRSPWTLRTLRGVENLDLVIRPGEVFGYLGPNGAGKTTTLKLLCGLHRPTRGEAWLFGDPIASDRSRRRLGFLPEHPYFYDYLSGLEYLTFAARLSGLHGHEASRRATHWIGRVGLDRHAGTVLRKYSKGMLQRLGLAAALVHAPDLLILDEPMSGLDPFGRRDVRDLILEQKERGTTVLFSSHILPDVEMISDRVGILLEGRLTRVATVGELVSDGRHGVEIRCANVSMLVLPAAWGDQVRRIERPHETLFVLERDDRTSEVLAWLIERGVEVRAVTPQRPTLEALFLETAAASRLGAEAREAV